VGKNVPRLLKEYCSDDSKPRDVERARYDDLKEVRLERDFNGDNDIATEEA
jgi:hypothetical protein